MNPLDKTTAFTPCISIIINSPPLSRIDGKEGIDLALVCAAFDHPVNLIFIEEGIFHLINQQDSSCFDDKLHDKQLNALEFYGIEQIHVEKESLQKYAICKTHMLPNLTILSRSQINQLCAKSTQTVIF